MSINKISIVVATYNRCESLKDVLNDMLEQRSNYENIVVTEILVVDNNSSDKTKDLIDSYKNKFYGKLKYFYEPRQGKCFALNSAITQTKGEIIAFLDDDVIIDSAWLDNLSRVFLEFNCDAVGGRVLSLYSEKYSRWGRDLIELIKGPIGLYDYGLEIIPYSNNNFLPFVGANMAVRRECFEEVGLFNTDLGVGKGTVGEEYDFFKRLIENNKKVCYVGRMIVKHKAIKPLTLRYIAQWYISYGRFLVRKESSCEGHNITKFFGVPRYLFLIFIRDACLILINIANKKKSLSAFISIFTNLGIMLEHHRKSKYVNGRCNNSGL